MAGRKGRRFTPQMLERFDREGRGRGTHKDFQSYHQISRMEPASRGTSTFNPGVGAFSSDHELSGVESLMGFFGQMLPYLDDWRSQLRLRRSHHAGELAEYRDTTGQECYPGTIQIAARLKIRHPVLREGDVETVWRMTTDAVATLRPPLQARTLLALSCKDVPFAALARRQRRLLAVEREYWLCQLSAVIQ